MKVLIAEDDRWSRDLVATITASLRHDATCVHDGQQAWDAFQLGGFEVLISDWRMPNLDGLELIKRVRASPGPRYTYIILITAQSEREHWLSAMAAGADDFIAKPLEPELLTVRLSVAERIVSLHAQMRQLAQIIPMCSYCRKIREADQAWLPLEAYVAQHTDSAFSHGICPECVEKYVRPELAELKRVREKTRDPL